MATTVSHGKEKMTRFPTESRNVIGLEGDGYEDYKVPASCSAPGCTKYTDHAHHLFSRGQMGSAYSYVRLDDGTEIGNLAPLCFRHHEMITNNAAWIQYEDGVFKWNDLTNAALALSWQPPRYGEDPTQYFVSENEVESRPICPACNRRLPKPKVDSPMEETKRRATWAVGVPVDVEDGAAVLDALIEASREAMDDVGLSYSDSSKAKYYVLSTALGLFVQHAPEILSDQ
jgi:hypothetical protein